MQHHGLQFGSFDIFLLLYRRGRYHKNVFEVGSLEVMDKNCNLTVRWNSTYSVILLPYQKTCTFLFLETERQFNILKKKYDSMQPSFRSSLIYETYLCAISHHSMSISQMTIIKCHSFAFATWLYQLGNTSLYSPYTVIYNELLWIQIRGSDKSQLVV